MSKAIKSVGTSNPSNRWNANDTNKLSELYLKGLIHPTTTANDILLSNDSKFAWLKKFSKTVISNHMASCRNCVNRQGTIENEKGEIFLGSFGLLHLLFIIVVHCIFWQ